MKIESFCMCTSKQKSVIICIILMCLWLCVWMILWKFVSLCKTFKHTGKCTDITLCMFSIWQQLYHNNVLGLCQRLVSMQYFKTKNTCTFTFAIIFRKCNIHIIRRSAVYFNFFFNKRKGIWCISLFCQFNTVL